MKVLVEFLTEDKRQARITVVPGWLARLFGAQPRTGDAMRMGYHDEWCWISTSRNIDADFVNSPIRKALELQPIVPLPLALARLHRKVAP